MIKSFLSPASKLFKLYWLSLLIIIYNSSPIQAQYSEIGFSIGGNHYSGDLIRDFRPLTVRPGASIFYRQNLTEPVSLRFNLNAGFIHGDDQDPIDPLAAMRDASFDIFYLEGGAFLEYHWFDFKSEKSLIRWTPYFVIGAGVFTFFGHEDKNGSYGNVQPMIPVGLGFKYLLNPRIILGFEYTARKTFFDYLDNVSEEDIRLKNYQYGNWYDNDWYYYFGFSFNYAFYDIPCPYKW
ncbi:MAG: DUF6089 family protein [Candidatus Cyclobacteriaceae bacterium M3_2C_046]